MPWYNNGTVAVTNNTTTVTGTGTAWIANASAGMGFRGPDRQIYEISSVNSDTQLTLATPYQGGTASGQAYSLLPTQDYVRTLAQQVATLIGQFGSIANNAGQGKFGDGTAAAPGITFGADQATGFYRLGASTFGVVTGGVLRQVWDASGNLGVGTASPGERIDSNGNIRVTGASNQRSIGFNFYGTSQYNFFVDGATDSSRMDIRRGTTTVATFDSSGNLLVGTTNPAGQTTGVSVIYTNVTAGASYLQAAHPTGTASGSPYANFMFGGNVIGSITQSGTTNIAITGTSDHRLKTNVRPADAKRFMDIEFVDFEWVDGRHDCGVIAHKLQAIYPDLVHGKKDATEVRTVEVAPAVPAVLDNEGNEVSPAIPAVTEEQVFPVYQQVNYVGLIARMGTVVQQQQRLIESLTARVAALESA